MTTKRFTSLPTLEEEEAVEIIPALACPGGKAGMVSATPALNSALHENEHPQPLYPLRAITWLMTIACESECFFQWQDRKTG